MFDIHHILHSLAKDRPAFYDEEDFQCALEIRIRDLIPDCEIYRKFKPFDGENVSVDLWVPTHGTAIALRYPRQRLSVWQNNVHFELKEHSAQDSGRYDFARDISRLERVVSEREDVKRGFAVILTNDRLYWDTPRPEWQTRQDSAFRIHDGRRLQGTLEWPPGAGRGSIKGRETPICLNGSYFLIWADYSQLEEGKHSQFRYLAIEVAE